MRPLGWSGGSVFSVSGVEIETWVIQQIPSFHSPVVNKLFNGFQGFSTGENKNAARARITPFPFIKINVDSLCAPLRLTRRIDTLVIVPSWHKGQKLAG